MTSLIDEFERMGPVNVSDIDLRRQVFGGNARITQQGRLFGVTDGFDELLSVRGAIMKDGRKMITVCKASSGDTSAIKSSAKTTGAPFLNVRNLCKMWFGDDCEKWKKKLRLVESREGVELYEVVEEDSGSLMDARLKQWYDEVADCIKENNKIEFSLRDIYRFEAWLAEKHPENSDIEATIRGTMQRLRDAGLVVFVEKGQYRVSPKFVTEWYL